LIVTTAAQLWLPGLAEATTAPQLWRSRRIGHDDWVISRRATALAVVAVLAAGAAGCGSPPAPATDVTSDTDRARAAVLSADPVLLGAVTAPQVVPGRVRSEKIGWDRTEVRARLYEFKPATVGAGPEPGLVEQQLAASLGKLRTGGWTVYWAMCLPPLTQATANVHVPGSVPRADGWQWLVFAYKVDKGVSYWSMLVAELDDTVHGAFVDIVMRAPQERDPANLFVDRPKALRAGRTCAEDRKTPTRVEQAGTPAVMRDWWPFPAASHSPNPDRR